MEAIGKLLDHLGYATPLLYAAAAYGFFAWLDENASDEAKAALARTMKLKDYGEHQIASALVEVFDSIYTFPLLTCRAFLRSLLLTTIVSLIYFYEAGVFRGGSLKGSAPLFGVVLGFNVIIDYISLFVIRPLLIRSGSRPVLDSCLAQSVGLQ